MRWFNPTKYIGYKMIQDVEQKFLRFIGNYNLLKKGDRVLVGFSGGGDSVFALYLLNKFRDNLSIELAAIHINHSLRGRESNSDQSFCREFCKVNQIKFYTVKVHVKEYSKEKKISIEEAAREMRYKEFEKFSEKHKYNKIVTAHNADDNAETVLLNLIKGTGVSGLSGIPIKRGKIIRPALSLAKEEIISYLNSRHLEYVEDSSNRNTDYQRNFIRHKIIPKIKKHLNPSLESAVFRTSLNLRSLNDLLNDQLNGLILKNIKFGKNHFTVSESLYKGTDQNFLGEVIKKVMEQQFNYPFNYDDYLNILSITGLQKGKSIVLRNNWIIIKESGHLLFTSKKQAPDVEIGIRIDQSITLNNLEIGISKARRSSVEMKKTNLQEFVSADNLDDEFIIRNWKPGDKFIPIGMNGFKKISDFLTDLKIPASERKNVLVLLNRNNIVWVIGLRIDDRYKITENTRKVLKLWMKKNQ